MLSPQRFSEARRTESASMPISIDIRHELNGRADIQDALDALTLLARRQLRRRALPRLYESGVRYKRESKRPRERWQTPLETLRRGIGDCEDLGTWRAAEVGGRAFPVRAGRGWHILVWRPDGRIEDPSRVLGMGQ